ncbi:MAG: DsbA family protein [Stagnimonas sp.]|nr:DsbA family protein [Stagnimonas sp.]
MDLVRTIRSAMMRRFADPARRTQQRVRAEAARQRQGRPHQVLYFHQVDDPYSQLAAQALLPLLDRYDIQLLPKVVARPTPIAIHEQALWNQWAARECAAMAPFYGLRFDPPAVGADLALARRILLATSDVRVFAQQAQGVSAALHSGERAALAALAVGFSLPSESEAEKTLAQHFDLRHRLGHYLGGMFYYEGEWYWGIDRLHYLEERLDALGARRTSAPTDGSVKLTRSTPSTLNTSRRLKLEFFPSLRSPYTHLSYARVKALCERYPVDLVLRPVLPMMMRGVKADRRKGVYILRDTQREAERLGIAFGNIWDPFGKPILRAYSLFPWARDQGRGFEYLHVYSQAVWGERVDAQSLQGLRGIVERAGLNWAEALKRLDNTDWEAEMETNVQDMIAAGSWGVPTLRLTADGDNPEFTVWGQDRIWLIEEEIIQRLSAP